MVNILFVAHGRPEFTRESLKSLLANTDHSFWRHGGGDWAQITIYTDGETYSGDLGSTFYNTKKHGGPVACLNHFIEATTPKTSNGAGASPNTSPEAMASEFVCKIDNDCIVPPGWLPACLDLMRRYPSVDLLGIEPWTPDEKLFPRWKEPQAAQFPAPFTRVPQSAFAHGEDSHGEPLWRNPGALSYSEFQPRPVSHIGGIGVFRRSAFERCGRPVPNSKDGRYGFTEWQWQHPGMVKAFIDPPLPVFLLDHLPFEPWVSLGNRYCEDGLQRRQWGFYDPTKHSALWEWSGIASGENAGSRGVDVGGPRL